jgi:alkanesulfonate monooxygenase SsuD/methylene tetrahydromethanopterin reductase-like flavin-dependent oxidoreductase (luciferase family)
MTQLQLRYDMRAPAFGPATTAELYATALDQVAWADRLGFDQVHFTEHHGSDDGYCPSPLVLASAVAARTQAMRIECVLVLPFYEPVRLAEDTAVLDLVSAGRLDLMLVGGYVAREFAMFGHTLDDRPGLVEEGIRVLRAAWSGEPFERDGHVVRVTPKPLQPGGPRITMGGSSKAAARRAARIADAFSPTFRELWDVYREACEEAGRDPGPPPGRRGPAFVHVAEDPDRAWAQIAAHALHENNSYGAWIAEAGVRAPYESSGDADALRAGGRYRVVTPEECIALVRDVDRFDLHPLMGGLPPALSWESLELFAAKVLPARSA